MSYFPDDTPGMIASNGADCHCVLRPNFAATALKSSTSQPTTVVPSGARYSFGAYVESTPMSSVPLDLMSAGTCAASDGSTDGVATVGVPAPLGVLPLFELLPHAMSD